ncbi:hypothetical protein Ndes2526B_g05601 [Nannochloris sp. 'desiccata']|nr:hypothetical protein KSW81_007456 [Chlorella desiccata (nom. nud.)]KAH7618686.1 putative Ankyrin repeat domain-containing protein 50 [Chlorella desiccata (nom. nud.)]
MDGLDEQLFKAVEVSNAEEIERLIARGANVNSAGRGTPIIVAASSGQDVDCLELLLNNGANVDSSDNNGYTSLMKASQLGHVYCVELLLNRGANIAAVTTDQQTALQIAAECGQIECMELLLKYGSNVDAVDAYGKTALMDAAARGNVACLELLLKHGARLNFDEALQLSGDEGHDTCVIALRNHLSGKMKNIKGRKNRALFKKKMSLVVVCASLVFASVKRLN